MNIAATINRSSPENRQRMLAFAISVLAHLLIILLVGFLIALRLPSIKPEPVDDTVELTIVEPPTPQTAKKEPDFVDSANMTVADKPPENPAFQSDRDTVAASSLPATGNAPVPTMQGDETNQLQVVNQEYTSGIKPAQAAQPAAPSKPVETTPPTPQEQPQPTPQPTAPPRAVSQLALLEPPKQKAETRPTPEKPVQQQDARPPQPQTQAQPAVPGSPGYQPQTRITRINGNVSARGRASVAAAATPLGRYKKIVSDQIGSRWYYYIKSQVSLMNQGQAVVQFVIRPTGKIENIQITRNTSNESLASYSVRAVLEAEIPPFPKELVPMLDEKGLVVDFTFSIN